jgi:diguanylate cyclase (GGDEF)-like protein/putative nucleotidyltransferase with HDIG domain
MPRSKRSASGRPLLLPLVYVATITLIGVSCAALAILGSEHVRTTAIRATVAGDQAAIRDFVATTLITADVEGSVSSPARRLELDRALARLADAHGYRDATVSLVDGSVLAGDAADVTEPAIDSERRLSAASGQPAARISVAADGSPVLTEAIPISVDGAVRLVVTLQRDAGFVITAANDAWRDVLLVTGFATLVLALLLRAIFQGAGLRLRRQAEELLESRRRDHLTGFINHGAAAARLTDVLAAARIDGSSVGIALVDIDNFRLLNETYGSPAGDEALLLVARALEAESGPWLALGRFGPDEFLAIAPAEVARELPAAMKRVQTALDSASLQFDGSERLPLTVSVGVTYFPFHATGVNELLSAATIALGEAKAGGGNRTVIADAWTSEPKASQSTFDVLQGLVVAIDTKDRYTKRHSEDVACYALFLAARTEMPEADRAILRTAGLLHDIGKIGIPDDILRKPGRLSPYEYEIVKQHVALGDLIVRDLPEIDLVRAGVRHHHERWDGNGYLDRLAGEQIPLFARILAVGDAFSAMTTTRPYRKALTVQEALDELRAAAGTQLDPELVALFVDGIEHDPDAPMPGADRNGSQLWTPTIRAA